MLTSSPGLRVPINSQPYGFQLWLLADVCPTHRSIWHTRDLVSPFGSFGVFCQILIISLHQVDWFFPRGVITAQCGCYLCMKVISVACSASSHSWESLPRFTCKMCSKFAEHYGLLSCAMMEFCLHVYKMNSIIKTFWRYSSFTHYCQM